MTRRLVASTFLAFALVAAGSASSSSKLPGLMTGKGPWGANDGKALKARLGAIGLDALPREALRMHIHQRMAIVVNRNFVYLPAGIGIDRNGKFITELHTHDSSGIIHVESPRVQKFTLGQFFDVWGLRFTKTCLGGYCVNAKNRLIVWTDGKRVQGDPRKIVLTEHLSIVVYFGTRKNIPPHIPTHFPFPSGY